MWIVDEVHQTDSSTCPSSHHEIWFLNQTFYLHIYYKHHDVIYSHSIRKKWSKSLFSIRAFEHTQYRNLVWFLFYFRIKKFNDKVKKKSSFFPYYFIIGLQYPSSQLWIIRSVLTESKTRRLSNNSPLEMLVCVSIAQYLAHNQNSMQINVWQAA